MDTQLFQEASNRFNQNIKNLDYYDDIDYLLLKIFQYGNPCHNDNHLLKKLKKDLPHFNLQRVPKRNMFIQSSNIFKESKELIYEIKLSFISKANLYTLKFPKKDLNTDYYILCLVDCFNNFKPNFTVIDKHYFNSSLPIENQTNLQFTFPRLGEDYRNLIDYGNKLEGTSYQDLIKFISDNQDKLNKLPDHVLQTLNIAV